MLQGGGELDLAIEAIHPHFQREVGGQHLDHDVPRELRLLGHKHAAHATAAELPLDAIGGAEYGL